MALYVEINYRIGAVRHIQIIHINAAILQK